MMAVNQFWEQPGDMLYDWRSRPWHGRGPIVSVRDDDSLSYYAAARWSPEEGWRWACDD